MAENIRLVLLPGMGADERLLAPQRSAFPSLSVPKWIPARRRESLRQYAERFAETLPAGIPFVLGGVSFGGMVACEVARVLRPRALVLIASASDNGFLRWRQRGAAAVGRWIPGGFIRRMPDSRMVVARLATTRDPAHSQLLVEMFRDADAEFLKWAAEAVASWKASPLPGDLPTFRLHGARDRIIPLRSYAGQVVVEKAGHLVNLTRPDVANGFLSDVLRHASA